MAEEYFTLVFKGNLKSFAGNPLRTETPFGIPFICALGNVCDEADELRETLSDLLVCADSECVSGSSHEPIEAARALVGGSVDPQ